VSRRYQKCTFLLHNLNNMMLDILEVIMQIEFSLLIKMIPLSAHKCHPSVFAGSLNMCHAVTCHAVTGQNWASLRALYPNYFQNNHISSQD